MSWWKGLQREKRVKMAKRNLLDHQHTMAQALITEDRRITKGCLQVIGPPKSHSMRVMLSLELERALYCNVKCQYG